MIKLDKNQIDSLEKVQDREELCEKIYLYLVDKKESFKAYSVNYEQLKSKIYKSFDLLVSLLITDNEVISQLIVWNTIMKKMFFRTLVFKILYTVLIYGKRPFIDLRIL